MQKYRLPPDVDLVDSVFNDLQVPYGLPWSGISTTSERIALARKGITMRYLKKLADLLDLNLLDLSKILHISIRTLQRYAEDKLLEPDVSSKVIRLAELERRGLDIFGDAHSFSLWLKEEVLALDGARPIDFLDTPFGFDLINRLLGRIEHGILS